MLCVHSRPGCTATTPKSWASRSEADLRAASQRNFYHSCSVAYRAICLLHENGYGMRCHLRNHLRTLRGTGRATDDRRFAHFWNLELREYPERSKAGHLDALLAMPYEFVLTQSWASITGALATKTVKKHRRLMVDSGDESVSQVKQRAEAMDDLTAKRLAINMRHSWSTPTHPPRCDRHWRTRPQHRLKTLWALEVPTIRFTSSSAEMTESACPAPGYAAR